MTDLSTLFVLFKSFLQIGAFAIGGGYATIPLIKHFIIDTHHWISLNEFTNMIAISQMTPGPLAINLSTFVGLKTGGILGSILATLGCVLTGVILSIWIYKFFKKFKDCEDICYILKGLRSSTTGLIGAACTMMILLALFKNGQLTAINIPALIVFIIGLLSIRVFKINMILLILLTGIAGLFI